MNNRTPIVRFACGEYDYDGGLVALVAIAPGVVSQARLDQWVSQALEMLAHVTQCQQYLSELEENTHGRDGGIPDQTPRAGGAGVLPDTGG